MSHCRCAIDEYAPPLSPLSLSLIYSLPLFMLTQTFIFFTLLPSTIFPHPFYPLYSFQFSSALYYLLTSRLSSLYLPHLPHPYFFSHVSLTISFSSSTFAPNTASTVLSAHRGPRYLRSIRSTNGVQRGVRAGLKTIRISLNGTG